MDKKEKPLKSFFIVFILVLFIGITGSILLRNYNSKKSPELFLNEKGGTTTTYESFPQIINEPPRSVLLNSTFTFTPRIVPQDDSVILSLISAPEWMSLEDFSVVGLAKQEGTFEFVLRLERNGSYVDEDFYLIVINE